MHARSGSSDSLALGGEQHTPQAGEIGTTGAVEAEVDQADCALPLTLPRCTLRPETKKSDLIIA